jgi:hypothetical protein
MNRQRRISIVHLFFLDNEFRPPEEVVITAMIPMEMGQNH